MLGVRRFVMVRRARCGGVVVVSGILEVEMGWFIFCIVIFALFCETAGPQEISFVSLHMLPESNSGVIWASASIESMVPQT